MKIRDLIGILRPVVDLCLEIFKTYVSYWPTVSEVKHSKLIHNTVAEQNKNLKTNNCLAKKLLSFRYPTFYNALVSSTTSSPLPSSI